MVIHRPRGKKLTPAEYEASNSHITSYGDVFNSARTATYVVAASDSPNNSKAGADTLCSGVADEVDINAAIASLE